MVDSHCCVVHIIPIVKCLVDICLNFWDFVIYTICEMSLVYIDWYLHHLLSVFAFCPRLFMECFEHTLTLCYV